MVKTWTTVTVYLSVRAKEIRVLPPNLPRTDFTLASISRALQNSRKERAVNDVVHVQRPFLISYEYLVYIYVGTSLA